MSIGDIVGFAGPNGSGDYTATNTTTLGTLSLTGSDNFILGLNDGSGWIADSAAPTSTARLASRGKPALRWPTSVVVPPTSTTMASWRPDRYAAPLMLLVGPDENEYTGNTSAKSARITVPSFWVRYRGACDAAPLQRVGERPRWCAGPGPPARR